MSNLNNDNQSTNERPKFRTSIRKDDSNQYEPLERRKIAFLDQNREKKFIPLISKDFNIRISCPSYYEPSFNEMNNFMNPSGWINNCKKFKSFLYTIVNLPYFRFWSVVAYNKEVHDSIEAYLSYSIRPYRIYPVLKNNDIRPTLSHIHSLVFRFYVRILLTKETNKNYMSEQYHSELLIKNNILDVSKIMDLIQLYGYGSNSEIIKYLLQSFLQKNFQTLKDDLKFVLNEIEQFLVCYQNEHCSDVNNDLVYVIANVTDVLFSLNKLVQIEPRIALLCWEKNILESLIIFYSKYFPFIETEIDFLLEKKEIVKNLHSYFKSQICLSQACALLLFHNVIRFAYVESLVNSNKHEDKYQIFENLINILNHLAHEKRFSFDYFSKFSFEKEFETLLNNDQLNDQLSIKDTLIYYDTNLKKTIQEYLSQKNKESGQNARQEFNFDPPPSETVPQRNLAEEQCLMKNAEIAEKEQLIIEMFPEYGNGFVYKCLEYFDFNNERVVDAILENNLPEALNLLNRNLTKADLTRKEVKEENKKFANDLNKYDPKTRTNYELADIYIGKKDKVAEMNKGKMEAKNKTIALADKITIEEEEMKENIKNLIERGKLQREDLKTNMQFMGYEIYDDEYDDTYENEKIYDFEPVIEEIKPDDDDDDDDDDSSENEDSSSSGGMKSSDPNNESTSSNNNDNVNRSKFRTNEKYENCAKFFRKQLYNKRNSNKWHQNQPQASTSNTQNTKDVRNDNSGDDRHHQQQQRQPQQQPPRLNNNNNNNNQKSDNLEGKSKTGTKTNNRQQQQFHNNPNRQRPNNNNQNRNQRR